MYDYMIFKVYVFVLQPCPSSDPTFLDSNLCRELARLVDTGEQCGAGRLARLRGDRHHGILYGENLSQFLLWQRQESAGKLNLMHFQISAHWPAPYSRALCRVLYKMKTHIVHPQTTRVSRVVCGCTMCVFRGHLALCSVLTFAL